MEYILNGSQLAKVKSHLLTLHIRESTGTWESHGKERAHENVWSCKCSTARIYRLILDAPILPRFEEEKNDVKNKENDR